MKELFKKTMATVSFALVVCMHMYFVLLVGTKPALAATEATDKAAGTVQSSPAAVNVQASGNTTADASNNENVKVQVDETGVAVTTGDDSADNDSTGDGEDDDKFSISIHGKDGIVVQGRGAEKIAAKLKKLEKLNKLGEDFDDEDSDRAMVLSASDTFSRTLENVLVPIAIFLIAFGFACYVVYSKTKTRKETLDTIRILAQNNQPIPPELLGQMSTGMDQILGKNAWGKSYDVNSLQGIKYVFIGLGIAGFLILIDRGWVGTALGFIFIVIGAFHLVKSQLIQKQQELKKSEVPAAPVATPNTNTPSIP